MGGFPSKIKGVTWGVLFPCKPLQKIQRNHTWEKLSKRINHPTRRELSVGVKGVFELLSCIEHWGSVVGQKQAAILQDRHRLTLKGVHNQQQLRD